MKKSPLQRLGRFAMVVWMILPALVAAQTTEIPFHQQAYSWKSAEHRGQQGAAAKTFLAESRRLEVSGVPWLRVYFEQAKLGANSYLSLVSRQDGARQDLNAAALAQWQNNSAYFNGGAVEVQLHVAPGDEGIFFQIKGLEVGEWVGGIAPPESQCGATDDRVPSNHPASGRIVSIGCTGWIISNGKHVTAGHCAGSGTLEFNVPPSLSNGTIQHPGPQDQYAINTGTLQFVNGGIGNDWCVFEVFNNTQTGLQPIQAQGASFTVVQNLGPPTIRITGFGVDVNDPTRNQTQQTHAGPNAGSSGTTMRYQVDTEGGNSGSPVIDDANGQAVGVHTHGGCTTGGGNNSGTSTFNTAFWAALGGSGGGGCSDIAQGDPASASSSQGSNVPSRANDGNNSTFWRSSSGGSQYWQVDLGSAAVSYGKVEINWRSGRHAKSYQIRVSNSANFSTFTRVFSTTTGSGGTETITLTGAPRTERYVRIAMSVPNNAYYGINEFKVCSSTSAAGKLSASAEAGVLTSLTLEQNFPNPFNPSTNISFGLPEESLVTLKIYNLIGEEVAILVNERRTAGTHSVVFDASHLPSGVYFSVLQIGEIRQVRRLVLMK
jgi:hypothetical protein